MYMCGCRTMYRPENSQFSSLNNQYQWFGFLDEILVGHFPLWIVCLFSSYVSKLSDEMNHECHISDPLFTGIH